MPSTQIDLATFRAYSRMASDLRELEQWETAYSGPQARSAVLAAVDEIVASSPSPAELDEALWAVFEAESWAEAGAELGLWPHFHVWLEEPPCCLPVGHSGPCWDGCR